MLTEIVVQHECIPQAILGTDVICQAKSGMGKTAVFVLSVLQQLDPNPTGVCIAFCDCGFYPTFLTSFLIRLKPLYCAIQESWLSKSATSSTDSRPICPM